MEHHHCALTFAILSRPGSAVLAGLGAAKLKVGSPSSQMCLMPPELAMQVQQPNTLQAGRAQSAPVPACREYRQLMQLPGWLAQLADQGPSSRWGYHALNPPP